MENAKSRAAMSYAIVCDICGKVLKGSGPEALAAHKRDSSTCAPQVTKGASSAVQRAEKRVADIIAEGRRHDLTFEELERNGRDRKEAEQVLKQARTESKQEKRAIKEMAAASQSAAGWTSALLAGEEARFAKAEEGAVDARLAKETVGFVTAAAFREKREALQAEEAGKAARQEAEAQAEVAARAERKAHKKRKREEQQRRGLSFDDEEDGVG